MSALSTVAILSPGLIGGSLALAIKERVPAAEVRVWSRRAETVDRVRALGLAAHASTDASEIAAGADLILFCMPIGGMAEVGERIQGVVHPDALVTDVGSVKQPVVETLGALFRGRAHFIGSHPMAGSEESGLEAARATLFENATCILTPEAQSDPAAVAKLSGFWESMGCRVTRTTARVHDEAVALISHLPHLVAAALVQTALRENPAALALCGNGFRDTTRVASGPPAMWTEIFQQNRPALKNAINAMIENLAEASKLLDAGDTRAVEHYLAEAKSERDRLKKKSIS